MARTRRFRTVLVAVPMAGALLAACGSSSSSTTTTSGSTPTTTGTTQAGGTAGGASTAAFPAACTLVTPTDITTALGTAPVAKPTSDEQTQCYYSSPASPNYVNASVTPVVLTKFFQQDANGAGATQAVSGLGQAAYETPVGAGAGSLFVLVGKQELRIDVYLPVTATTQAAMQQLAKTALSRTG